MLGNLIRSIGVAAVCLVAVPAMTWAQAEAPHGDKPAVEAEAHEPHGDHAHAAGGHQAEAHGGDAHGGEHGGGLPMSFTQDLALFSLVTFVVYVIVLRLAAWGPLRSGLLQREQGIHQAIADAEANRVKSELMIAERERKLAAVQDEVRELLAEARRDADRLKHDIVTTAQTEAEATKNRAIAEIERSRDQALAELFDFVSNNVVGATEKVIGRSLSSEDHNRLVTQALSELNVRRN